MKLTDKVTLSIGQDIEKMFFFKFFSVLKLSSHEEGEVTSQIFCYI